MDAFNPANPDSDSCSQPVLVTPENGRVGNYEAKAHFSEIIRQVREGETVTVTYGGMPVAEIRPIAEPVDLTVTFESWWEELVRKGIIVPSNLPPQPRRPGGHIPGALERFLTDCG